MREILDAEPKHVDAQRRLAIMHQQNAELHFAQAEWDAALRELDETDRLYDQVLGADPGNTAVQFDMLVSLDHRWNIEQVRPNLAAAGTSLRKLISAFEKLDHDHRLEHAQFRQMYAARATTLAAWDLSDDARIESGPNPVSDAVRKEWLRIRCLRSLEARDWETLRHAISAYRDFPTTTGTPNGQAEEGLILAGLSIMLGTKGEFAPGKTMSTDPPEFTDALDLIRRALAQDRSLASQLMTHPWLLPLRTRSDFRAMFDRVVNQP
ncbi:MAG TPA: hypothetical protein VIY86_06675 [Pirellulaceae bacterium]